MKNTGFTLLEVIIYLTLFSMLMTGVLQTVYIVLETTSSNEDQIDVLTESTFVNQKFMWALSGATAVNLVSSTTLQITRPDLGSDSPLFLSISEGAWYLQRGSGAPSLLTSSELTISDVVITLVSVDTDSHLALQIRYQILGVPYVFQSVLPYE